MMNDSNPVNFQIQYFPEDKRDKFKDWSRNNDIGADSMKSLLIKIIDNKDFVEKALKNKLK